MNWADFFSQGLILVGAFSLKIGLLLFVLNLIGEALAVSVPYLLETTWLLAGYQFSAHVLPPLDVLLLMAAAMAGRQCGELILYNVSRSGSALLGKYLKPLKIKPALAESTLGKVFRRINLLSPISVAVGRLLWLRIPLTLVLAAKGNLKVLMMATVLSSLVYDATYIALGAIVGKTTRVQPALLVLYFLVTLTLIYGITFAVRYLLAKLNKGRQPVSVRDNEGRVGE